MRKDRELRKQKLILRLQASQAAAGLPSPEGMLLCPLCWLQKPISQFTVEHIVPGRLSGRRTTLTCSACNNGQGSALDAHLVNYHMSTEALNGSGAIKSELLIGTQRVAVELSASQESRQMKMRVIGSASHPGHIKGIQDDLTNGKMEAMTVRMHFRYNKNQMQTALLRIGYLALFHRFGFRYASQSLVTMIRDRINDPSLETFRLASFVCAINKWTFPFDRDYVVIQDRLGAMPYFLVAIRCRKDQTAYHGVALPGIGLDDPAFFSEFEKFTDANRQQTIRNIAGEDVIA